MKNTNSIYKALLTGSIASLIGLLTFTLNHQLIDHLGGPIPGYQVILLPGNLSLIYFWHPIFTEEVNFWPKLIMLLTGQLSLVAGITYLSSALLCRVKQALNTK